MISAAVYTSEAENRANAKAIRQRLLFGGRKATTANQNGSATRSAAEPRDVVSFPIPRPAPVRRVSRWERNEVPFDEHITAWKLWKEETEATNGAPLRSYIQRRSRELCVPYAKVVGTCRTMDIVRARQLIMWEIKTLVRPGRKQGERNFVSYPEIGRLFGGRDHTTVLHAVKKIEEQKQRQAKQETAE